MQVHKHSQTWKSIFQFGFSLPSLAETMLLELLDTECNDYKKYIEIQEKMKEYKDGCSLTYAKLKNYQKMNISNVLEPCSKDQKFF